MSSVSDWEQLVSLQAALHGVLLSPRQTAAVARTLVRLAQAAAWVLPAPSQAGHV